MTWVKFHEELTKGVKRGIPRGVRFVLLELSLAARRRRGAVELPLGMADVDGVHDLLGGDRAEVEEALRLFTSGADPVMRFEDGPEGRVLVVVKWSRWNSVEEPGASTERTRRYRAAHRDAPGTDAERDGNVEGTVSPPVTRERGERSQSRVEEEEKIPSGEVPPFPPLDPVGSEIDAVHVPPARAHVGATPVPLHAPEVHVILDALRAGPLAPIATAGFAARVLGRWTCGRPIDGLVKAIDDVVLVATDAGWSEDYMRSRVAAYVTTANKSPPLARTNGGNGRGRPAPGTLTETGAKYDARGRIGQPVDYEHPDIASAVDHAEKMRAQDEAARKARAAGKG